MIFYDTIRTAAEFRREAAAEGAQSFQTLSSSVDWKTAASSWGIQHLFACRVLCRQPRQTLFLVRNAVNDLKRHKKDWHPVINELINGPRENMLTLGGMPEISIVQAYQNDGLGHLWASLAPLVKTEPPPTSDRHLREQIASESTTSQSSSVEETPQPPTPASAGSNLSSIGYHEVEWAPLLEDMTVRFASFFIRHILNYCQPLGKTSPIQYRDARKAHKADALPLHAIDDGGFQVVQSETVYQVAILEAKRAFHTIRNGTPTVSNELLAQMVGEALGVIASESSIFQDKVFIILAIKHFVKFFSFSISDKFMVDFKTMSPADNADRDTYLEVDSTNWLDATNRQGRLEIVSHVMALVECTDHVISPGEDG